MHVGSNPTSTTNLITEQINTMADDILQQTEPVPETKQKCMICNSLLAKTFIGLGDKRMVMKWSHNGTA